ncbi:MAG: MurR/RpiR family transcriptional regulator [Synergistaceae bacterium]|nr:MurR/RpiR family transcriptional regulator [Synergistaceae bacterium]
MQTEDKMREDLLSLFRNESIKLSLKQRELCNYVIENYKKIAFWTVEELSKNSHVSPATVVRTVKSLGFESYREMIGKIQNDVINDKIPLWWNVEKSWDIERTGTQVLTWVARDNIGAITASINNKLLDAINMAAKTLSGAEKICIVAVRSSRAIGIFLHSMLSQMMNNVYMINYGEDEMYDMLTDMGNNDLIVVISMGGPHYAMASIKAAEYGHNNSIKTIVLTNSQLCPAALYADILLCVEQTENHYSLASAITAIEALVIETGAIKKEVAIAKMRKLEKTLIEKNITL